jgi:bleomycin hydrolase
MLKYLFCAVFFLLSASLLFGQVETDTSLQGYFFSPEIELAATSVENQHRSGTCWSYAANSFFESEMLRMGKPEVDLSEMFVVWHCYAKKAEKYVRMHGNTNFGAGGAFHDATWVIENFGMVPEEAYSGLIVDDEKHIHAEMDAVLKAHVETIIKNKNRELSPVWYGAYKRLLNSYLGELPQKFEYKGEEYTPQSFVREYMGIKAGDYVEIGSFTHHPFYSKFILEVPDNWMWGEIYNVPLSDMLEIIDYALQNGYTVAWAADVSDNGFASRKKGVAVIPEIDVTEMTGAEILRWEELSETEKEKELYKLDKPGSEKTITQAMRQINFDNYTTTDDHGMHIIGTARDQNGTLYYKVKNSWGEYNMYDGYFYASVPYIALQTLDIMVHKNAIPQKIAKKMGL